MKISLLKQLKVNGRDYTDWLELLADGQWLVCEYVDGEFWSSREAEHEDLVAAANNQLSEMRA